MKTGIYGGTFDPPHLGHMQAARAAMVALELDRLFLIPAGIPPHKQLSGDTAPGADRLAMLTLMADGLGEHVTVLDLELKRNGKSYTADTLELLCKEYQDDEFWLLMGSDMFLTFQYWSRPDVIAAHAGLAAFARSKTDTGELFAIQRTWLSETFGARICTIELPVIEVSSSALRASLAHGEGREQLYPPVYGYILREGLYGRTSGLRGLGEEDLRCVSYSMIKAKRIAHIRGTEQEAVRLAERWGADVAAARRAAILHDCTKYLTLDEQLGLCRKYGVVLDELERQTLKLLHAKTGCALARSVFGEREEVCQAICWHTTGRAGMTTLEKVLYLADYIEPTRDFDGVEALRALADCDLNAAVAAGLEMTIAEMKEKDAPIHGNTIGALNDLKGAQ